MDEIKPVAWACAQDWASFQADRQECRLFPNFYWGDDLSADADFAPLYDQQAIDTLRAEVEAHKLNIDIIKDCAAGSLNMGRGLISEYAARAERAEAEAEALRKDEEGRWDEWLSHALSKWPEAEAALIATRVALGPTDPITQVDIDFAKREAL